MSSSSFDPETQELSFISAYGETEITFKDIESFVSSNISLAVIYGCRVGCAGLMFLILRLLTKNRKTPVFILNELSLFFLIMHSSLYIHFLLGGFNSATYYFTSFGNLTGDDYRTSICADILQVLLIACIESSLTFQVRVVFKSPEVRKIGLLLTLTSAALGLTTLGFYFAACVRSIISLYSDVSVGVVLSNYPMYIFSASVVYSCLILVIKLGLAIRSRRYLGLKQFGTLHILFIMSSQTMIIPAVVVMVSHSTKNLAHSRLTAVSILLVTLQLPLSSMWASSANNSSNVPTITTQTPFLEKSHSGASSSAASCPTSNGGGSTLYASSIGEIEKGYTKTNMSYSLYPEKYKNMSDTENRGNSPSDDKQTPTSVQAHEIDSSSENELFSSGGSIDLEQEIKNSSWWQEAHLRSENDNQNDSTFIATTTHRLNDKSVTIQLPAAKEN
ncbi:hypothetical protein PACTADRAFT_2293 [Pachysolen tannophilus NRRL Y-2460]|uniref:Pheromone alpha factor receptor n=1 Tax=Pachysolen tannophilus NRRL Y-2460 TaxID=669874 RepID=A0A1E4TW52_PACTA|nr:hypothetical protein PACTADRAFT_2293 [Pachysolen tannophilus NRRL Y-2460]